MEGICTIYSPFKLITMCSRAIFILSFGFLVSVMCLKAQINLVPNPDFDEMYKCPTWHLDMDGFVKYWSRKADHPEYAACSRQFLEVALSGDSTYIKCQEYDNTLSFGGEYAQVKLFNTLQPDKNYYIEYKAIQQRRLGSLSEVRARRNSGVLFVEDSTYGLFDTFFVRPQFWDTMTWVTDTAWTTVCGCFQVDEPLQWMVVGNFVNYREFPKYLNRPYRFSSIAYDEYVLSEIPDTLRIVLQSSSVCVGEELVLSSNHSLIKGKYKWKIEGSDSLHYHTQTVRHTWHVPGQYKVDVQVEHCGGFFKSDTSVIISVYEKPSAIPDFKDTIYIQSGDSVELSSCYSSPFMKWTGTTPMTCADCPHPKVSPDNIGIYYSEAGISHCIKRCTVVVIAISPPVFGIKISDTTICENSCITLTNESKNAIRPVLLEILGPSKSVYRLDNNLSVCFDKPGTYAIQYKIFGKLDTLMGVHTQLVSVFGYPLEQANVEKEITMYAGDSVKLYPCFNARNYKWQSNNLDCVECPSPLWRGNSSEKIKMTAYDDLEECYLECDYFIELKYKKAQVWFPNIISPNGDGHNDQLEIFGEYFEPLNLQVFDRWGELLYNSTEEFRWNGMYHGKHLNPSVFIVKLTYKNLLSNTVEYKVQDITLVR